MKILDLRKDIDAPGEIMDQHSMEAVRDYLNAAKAAAIEPEPQLYAQDAYVFED